MSHVDNWLLLPGAQVTERFEPYHRIGVDTVNRTLLAREPDRPQVFEELDRRSWGGLKSPEVSVFGLAANHVPVRVVLDAVARVPWPEPENGTLMLLRQDDPFWIPFRLDELVRDRDRILSPSWPLPEAPARR